MLEDGSPVPGRPYPVLRFSHDPGRKTCFPPRKRTAWRARYSPGPAGHPPRKRTDPKNSRRGSCRAAESRRKAGAAGGGPAGRFWGRAAWGLEEALRGKGAVLLDGPVYGLEGVEQGREIPDGEHVGTVAGRAVGILVHLHEDAGYADGGRGPGQQGDEAPVAAAAGAAGAG